MVWILYTGYSAVCTKTLKDLSGVKLSKIFFFWFCLILLVYLTRKTCFQQLSTSLNILGHPILQSCLLLLQKNIKLFVFKIKLTLLKTFWWLKLTSWSIFDLPFSLFDENYVYPLKKYVSKAHFELSMMIKLQKNKD